MKIVCTLLSLIIWFPVAATASALENFSFTYAVNYSIAKGSMKLTLNKRANNKYRFESVTKASGIAKLAVPNIVTESADFEIKDGTIRALQYQLNDGSKNGEQNISIVYDWKNSRADINSDKGPEQKPLTPDTMDQLIMQAFAMLNAQAGETEFSYMQLKPGRRIDRYTYSLEGKESLKTPAGIFDAVKYKLSPPNSDKLTYYWFAPEFNFAPIRIERFKKGKSVFIGQLKTIH